MAMSDKRIAELVSAYRYGLLSYAEFKRLIKGAEKEWRKQRELHFTKSS